MDTLTLEDISKDLRLSIRTVSRLAKSGDLPVYTVPNKGGFKYTVPVNQYFDWKKQRKIKQVREESLSNLDLLREEQVKWLEWCRNGKLTGKPHCEITVELNDYFLNYYLKRLPRRYRQTPLITIKSVRDVLGSLDPKSFSLKANIHKAVCSFLKYLIANGFATQELLDGIRELKPKRLYPPKKLHCTIAQFEALLTVANKRCNGQSGYDVILNVATIATIGFTGLRASELCNLRMQDIDLVNRKLFVYLGKGKKNRYVGICSRLYNHLVKYLEARPKTNLDNFFVTISSSNKEPVKIHKNVLLHKVKRLAKRVGFDINLHGLRRTFATVAANAGKPINIISLALGHADIKTTQGYLMTTQDEVIKEMQGW